LDAVNPIRNEVNAKQASGTLHQPVQTDTIGEKCGKKMMMMRRRSGLHRTDQGG